MSEFEGRCLCGAVRFAIAPPTLFFAHCHCRWCREAHGAAFVSWVGAAEERFRFLPGSAQPTLVCVLAAEPPRLLPAPAARRSSSPRRVCPGEIHVARPAIPGPIDREPQCHVFYDQRAEWIELGDALPRYDERRSGAREIQGGSPLSASAASVVDRLRALRARGRRRRASGRARACPRALRAGPSRPRESRRPCAAAHRRARGPVARPRLPRRRRG